MVTSTTMVVGFTRHRTQILDGKTPTILVRREVVVLLETRDRTRDSSPRGVGGNVW